MQRSPCGMCSIVSCWRVLAPTIRPATSGRCKFGAWCSWSASPVSALGEVGMNGGHSAAAMLLANPHLTVHSFDLMFWNYSRPVVRMLGTAFGDRFISHPGNSRVAVPEWAAEVAKASNRPPCDVMLVDGDHSLQGATADLNNFRALAAPHAPVIVDDIATAPGGALKALERSGALVVRDLRPVRRSLPPQPLPSHRQPGQMCLLGDSALLWYK